MNGLALYKLQCCLYHTKDTRQLDCGIVKRLVLTVSVSACPVSSINIFLRLDVCACPTYPNVCVTVSVRLSVTQSLKINDHCSLISVVAPSLGALEPLPHVCESVKVSVIAGYS